MKRVIIGAWLLGMMPMVWANDLAEVQNASQSVYRVWLGIPLPTGFVKQTDGSHIQALQNRHFAEQVPLKGLNLKHKKSGKVKELKGKGILFEHSGQFYLLVASGSAYAVSKQGHLVSNAKLADNSASTDVMFVDEGGMRDMGANGGQAEVFVLTKQPASALVLHTAKPLARDVKQDLAILHAPNLPTTPLKLADSQFAKPADRVFALGAEGNFDHLTGKQDAIDRLDYTSSVAHEGKLDKRITEKQVHSWLHNANVSGSMSGGALVNQCGQVLGTNQADDGNNQAGKAIDVGEVLPMLRKHSIAVEVYQGRCGGVVAKAENLADGAERVVKAAQHNPRGWLTVLALGILTLVSAFVAWRLFWWTWRKRRAVSSQRPVAAQTPVAPVSPVSPAPASPPPVSANNPIYSAASAAARVFGNEPSRTFNKEVPPTYQDKIQGATLLPLTGSLKSIQLLGRPMIVGRQNNCDVVLDNPKISRQHAKLWLDNGVVYVEDLKSTNGTLVNGVSISSITRLHDGDILQFTHDESVARFRLPEQLAAVPRTHADFMLQHPVWELRPLQSHLPPIQITSGRSVNVGRAPDNDVVIAAQVVSWKHATLWLDEQGGLMLKDNNSTNGTFVDNTHQRITQTHLHIGQTVYFAESQTAYRVLQQS